jgi:hypothetical protein
MLVPPMKHLSLNSTKYIQNLWIFEWKTANFDERNQRIRDIPHLYRE